ncbi:MAG: Fic family protein [Atopobiaceae bacterium]|nr:Fic family protein [Atopobiaceae bacterium]
MSPTEFLQAIYQLPRTPRTASLRRSVREVARAYARTCAGDLSIPTMPDDFHAMWDNAMEGEPLWSEGVPSSAFRTTAARILSGKSLSIVLQQCAEPCDYETELSHVLAFVQDETIEPEVRAACSYALFEWIHPFLDGNGHVGRMLVLALLQDTYSLPTMVWFSQTLVWGRGRTSGLFAPLRNGDGTFVGFCRGTLEQLHEAQEFALNMLMEA